MNGYVKLGIPLNKDNSSNIAGVIDYTYHKLESFFGRKNYNGEQNSLFVNLIYQNEFNEKHKLVAGLNGVYDKFDENLEDYFFTGNIGGQNHIPLSSIRKLAGAFAEYTYTEARRSLCYWPQNGQIHPLRILYCSKVQPEIFVYRRSHLQGKCRERHT